VRTNEFGQPIGDAVEGWAPPPVPGRVVMEGRYCRLEPLSAAHAAALFAANSRDDGRMWTYLPYGPFANGEDYESWVEFSAAQEDTHFYAIVSHDRGPVGVASYLRIQPGLGTIEVGHLAYSPLLQQTTAATEAMYLMMANAFALGYRRYEWKCDSFNYPSRAAAQRLGFSWEGTWRQALVVKARNRDTSWLAITDSDWPALRDAFETWLAPGNFDDEGAQVVGLSMLTRPLLKAIDPGD
jgi:RimJ/RimL family protein N-acetyltransferase